MRTFTLFAAAAIAFAPAAFAHTQDFSVGAQYDSTHVYVAPQDVDAFVSSFVATFGGQSTKQVVATVTPTPSSTTSQLVQTPVGIVSVFGFRTPVPYPFGQERTGYLVTNVDEAVKAANAVGGATLVAPFDDPIGRDAVVAWPGGVNMQLYSHTKTPDYKPLEHVPENRVYVPVQAADAFVKAWLAFSHGKVESDDKAVPATEIGAKQGTYRRVRITSGYGRLTLFVTNGHLTWPYGSELTGYEVGDLDATLDRARQAGAKVVVDTHAEGGRRSAMVQFPGGYVAEIHADAK
ncbi:VOC family protein [Luteibacter aegosomatissinici]|uniref:VOC family protein n=1 Tax=Luteibacter aegosomatissinici TaxID=2911539 RepID=UPI001FFAEA62|nr:glyoxalase [Luteibacter aegosomatissinici]UPG92516.1 glyoxalase [Luteibacter aegosomatissinici]